MANTQVEALKLALEALEYFSDTSPNMAGKAHAEDAITAIKAALSGEAQTRSVVKDEPVVWNEGVPAMLPKQKEGETFIVSYEPKLEAKGEPVANSSAWFALVMNAAAELEDASHCLRDEDAKQVAIRGAKYYREQAHALYTTPPQRTWVGLTDEEIRACIQSNKYAFEIVRAAEAKLRSKNYD